MTTKEVLDRNNQLDNISIITTVTNGKNIYHIAYNFRNKVLILSQRLNLIDVDLLLAEYDNTTQLLDAFFKKRIKTIIFYHR